MNDDTRADPIVERKGDSMRVTLHGKPAFSFSKHSSAALRSDVSLLASGTRKTAFAGAILGVCWRGKGRPRTRLGDDLVDYGYAVFDWLCGHGFTESDIWELATEVMDLHLDPNAPDPEEVQAAQDFIEPPPAPGTSV